jgi:putative acetyltransferase
MVVREETPADVSAIQRVVSEAFGRPDEADLVDRLRIAGDAVVSLVAEEDGIVGHVLLSRMSAPFPALGLAPLSVAPSHQRRGVGSRLVRDALDRARRGGWRGVFVLGEPEYYRRFGFDPSLASGFACDYAGPFLMALALEGGLPVGEGRIAYAPAFAALGSEPPEASPTPSSR